MRTLVRYLATLTLNEVVLRARPAPIRQNPLFLLKVDANHLIRLLADRLIWRLRIFEPIAVVDPPATGTAPMQGWHCNSLWWHVVYSTGVPPDRNDKGEFINN